jgi:hypothetical protein
MKEAADNDTLFQVLTGLPKKYKTLPYLVSSL